MSERGVITEMIEAGRSLLRAQPMSKDDYLHWSDSARLKVTEKFGLGSPKTQEFVKARWEISTSLDSDPSMYLTQVGANLRRELRTLEKFLRQEGGTPPVARGREPAFALQRLSSGGASPRPSQGSSPAAPPAPRESAATKKSVLVLTGSSSKRFDQATRIVSDLGMATARVSQDDRRAAGPFRVACASTPATAALLFVDRDQSSRGAKARPKIDSVLQLGILLGVLGPERVIALVDPKVALPDGLEGVRRVAIGDEFEADLKDALRAS